MTSSLRRLATCLALLVVAAALVSPMGAAAAKKKAKPPATGTWAGTATYTSPPDWPAPGIEYESSIVLSTSKDGKGVVRLSSFIATVRTYCLSGVRDIRVVKASIRKGPVIKGGSFSYTTQGVTVEGILGRPNGSGTLRASAQSCDLTDGVWSAKKRKY